MVDKKYVDSKTFTSDTSKGLVMKGSKVINVEDPTSATDRTNKRYVDTKTSNYWKTDGIRVMTGNLNMKNRNMSNVKQAQAHESTHAADVNFVSTTINNNNTLMTNNYQKYVDNRLNLFVESADL